MPAPLNTGITTATRGIATPPQLYHLLPILPAYGQVQPVRHLVIVYVISHHLGTYSYRALLLDSSAAQVTMSIKKLSIEMKKEDS
jgi:hypothetical protein